MIIQGRIDLGSCEAVSRTSQSQSDQRPATSAPRGRGPETGVQSASAKTGHDPPPQRAAMQRNAIGPSGTPGGLLLFPKLRAARHQGDDRVVPGAGALKRPPVHQSSGSRMTEWTMPRRTPRGNCLKDPSGARLPPRGFPCRARRHARAGRGNAGPSARARRIRTAPVHRRAPARRRPANRGRGG